MGLPFCGAHLGSDPHGLHELRLGHALLATSGLWDALSKKPYTNGQAFALVGALAFAYASRVR